MAIPGPKSDDQRLKGFKLASIGLAKNRFQSTIVSNIRNNCALEPILLWDWELMMGVPFINRLMAGLLKPTKITILGCDIAGRVEGLGKNVKQLQPGDEVFGDLSRSGWGEFAEYVCVREIGVRAKYCFFKKI